MGEVLSFQLSANWAYQEMRSSDVKDREKLNLLI